MNDAATQAPRDAELERERLANRTLTAIVDAAADAIMTEAPDGRVLSWSTGAERLLGYAARDAVGERSDLLLGEDPPHSAADVATQLAGIASLPAYEAVYHRKDGSPVDVSVIIGAVRDDTGRLMGLTRIAQDIGARRDAERRIAQMSRDYAVLRALNAAIVRIRDRTELLGEACRVAVARGGFRLAWVAMTADDAHAPIVVAHAGDDRDLFERLRSVANGNGQRARYPAAIIAAIEENRTVVENDIAASATIGSVRDDLARGRSDARAFVHRFLRDDEV